MHQETTKDTDDNTFPKNSGTIVQEKSKYEAVHNV
jgi:hypothetical protein